MTEKRGKVIGIVGSMRFRAYMDELERRLIRAGHTPIAPTRCFDAHEGNLSPADKLALDGLHLAKLQLCDSIIVVDPGGYVGESTRKEIAWAGEVLGLPIEFLSDGESDDLESVSEALGIPT